MMNELQQMKMQIAQMMNMIKQKDDIIAEQNAKLNGLPMINNMAGQIPMGGIPQNIPPVQMNIPPNMQQNMQLVDNKNNFLGYPQNYGQYMPAGFGNNPIPNMH